MGLDYRVRCCPDGLMTDRRRSVKVLDCSIRDGGCCNQWQFSHELVAKTVKALSQAGIDIMEVGYQSSDNLFDPSTTGPWRFCHEEDLRQVVDASEMTLATMIDVGRIRKQDLRPADDSAISLIRIATYAHQLKEAIELINHAKALGYQVACNIMAVTTCPPEVVDDFLRRLADTQVDLVYVVDSFGALYPHHLRYLIRKYKNWLRNDQTVGVHLHNNQQTAFANCIAAIDEGIDVVDATILGIGRGAGNCPLELLLMYLDDPRFDVRPILGVVDDFAALQQDLRWGYQPPYAITGWLNMHPQSAITRVQSIENQECLEFFDALTRDNASALQQQNQT